MAIVKELKNLGKKMTGADLAGNTVSETLKAIEEKYTGGGSAEPTYETVAEIEVGTMVENHGLYMFQPSDKIPLAKNETLFFNSEEYPLEYAEEGTTYYYNFDVSTGTVTGTPAYAVFIDGGSINALLSDTDGLSNTTVRILKKVEHGGGGELPENLKPTYEFGFTVTPGQTEDELIVTPDSGSTYAAITAALAETPNVYAVIDLGFQYQIIRALFSIDANGSGTEARQALAIIWNGTKFMGARLAVASDDSCDLVVRET